MIRPTTLPRPPLARSWGDGCTGLIPLALGLIGAGVVALILAASGRFLPHEEQYLGMTAAELCALHGCRVVHFMIHDRASFGGVLVALGLIYLWIIRGPLRGREVWAWWTLLVSGLIGFASFLTCLGHGYLDVWHGVATLGLLPWFMGGMIATASPDPGRWRPTPRLLPERSGRMVGLGRLLTLAASSGVALGGLIIMVIGTTAVFVPEDLSYLGVEPRELVALNPRLIPLIAHDRAGFGGALIAAGVALAMIVRNAPPTRPLGLFLLLVGVIGLGPAIGVHFAVGYTDPVHLAPAALVAVVLALGLSLILADSYRSRGLAARV